MDFIIHFLQLRTYIQTDCQSPHFQFDMVWLIRNVTLKRLANVTCDF